MRKARVGVMPRGVGEGLVRSMLAVYSTWTRDLDCGLSVIGLVGVRTMSGRRSYSRS